jgi:hypothetical protein
MPNWCENDLIISGNIDLVKKVLEGIKKINPIQQASNPNCPQDIIDLVAKAYEKGELKEINDESAVDFNTAIKYPPELAYGNPLNPNDGYNWCIKNWGTKWNASDPKITLYKRSAKIKFNTAWGPPNPVITAWSKKFPKVRFSLRFYECGMAFKGHLVMKAGKILINENSRYRGCRGG